MSPIDVIRWAPVASLLLMYLVVKIMAYRTFLEIKEIKRRIK